MVEVKSLSSSEEVGYTFARRSTLADWLTVERAAYVGVTALALGIRLWGLAWMPLGPAEATQALPALAAAGGQEFTLTGVSPLLFTLQRLLFSLFGASEALARWWSAALGGLAASLFYFLRDRLGAAAALTAALLWALSPLAVFTGRQGVGQGLVAPLALTLLAALATRGGGDAEARRHEDAGTSPCHLVTPSPRHLVAAIALGLLLTSGPAAYTVLLSGIVAAVIWRAKLPGCWQAIKANGRAMALAGGLTLTFAATCFLTAPAGLAAAAELAGTWLRGLVPGADEYGVWDVLRRLLLSEPLLLAFGVGGLVMALRRRDRFGIWAGVAAGIALLVPLIGNGRHPAEISAVLSPGSTALTTGLALVALALCLLAGPAVAATLRTAWSWRGELDPWLLVSLSLALLTATFICLASAPNTANRLDWQQLYTSVGIATAVLTVLLWTVYGIWGSWDTVGRALPVVPLIFLLAWSIGQMTGLSYDRDPNRRSAVLAEIPAANWAEFRAELSNAVAQRGTGGGEARIDVLLAAAGRDPLAPMLHWALRDYRNVRFITNLPADLASVVITDPQKYAALAERYTGADFTLLERWRPESLAGYFPWLRWLLYREAKTQAEEWKIVVWVERKDK
jgi:hypothetical protein